MRSAFESALAYLVSVQELTGTWFGRWGSNYIYGTSKALCIFVYFNRHNVFVEQAATPPIRWLKKVQYIDGGWEKAAVI